MCDSHWINAVAEEVLAEKSPTSHPTGRSVNVAESVAIVVGTLLFNTKQMCVHLSTFVKFDDDCQN